MSGFNWESHWPSTTLHMVSSALGLTVANTDYFVKRSSKGPSLGSEARRFGPPKLPSGPSLSIVPVFVENFALFRSLYLCELRESYFLLLPSPLQTLTLASSTLSRDQFWASMEPSQCHCEFTCFLSISQNPNLLSLGTFSFDENKIKSKSMLAFLAFHVGRDFFSSCTRFVSFAQFECRFWARIVQRFRSFTFWS